MITHFGPGYKLTVSNGDHLYARIDIFPEMGTGGLASISTQKADALVRENNPNLRLLKKVTVVNKIIAVGKVERWIRYYCAPNVTKYKIDYPINKRESRRGEMILAY